jgi:1,2-dihydroxy-3-keto-5-methylthiopentene dioxygenase
MTLVQIMADGDADEVRLRTDDVEVISLALARRGISFDRWHAWHTLEADTPITDLLTAYRDHIADLNADGRYKYVDVARVQPNDDDPRWLDTATAARENFLSEHRHAEDEVRFFVAGRGCFYLHLEPEVVAVVCEGGDLLSVPAGIRHWFDMGVRPNFVAIRFFEEQDGWIGDFTGDSIGERFPTLDQLTPA